MIIAACFYADKSAYPNLASKSWEERNAVYWRCMTTLAYSVRTLGKHRDRFIIFSNQEPPAQFEEHLSKYRVEVIDIPFGYKPPEGFYPSFIGALYLLDSISWAAKNLGADESILFLDPDCIVLRELSPIEATIERSGLVAYDQNFGLNHKSNGLSRADIWSLEDACFDVRNSVSAPRWLGGELLGLRGDVARQLDGVLKSAWAKNLALFQNGALKFNTEEQILSAAVHAARLEFFDAGDGYIKRIWTASVYRKYDARDEDLLIWHLPSEKSYGLNALFERLSSPEIAAPSDSAAAIKTLSKLCGLRGSLVRELTYIARTTLARLRGLATGRINRYD